MPKVALVYDRVNKWGGAERVLLALHELFPDAPLYTSVYSPAHAPWAKVFPQVIPSFLQKFPFASTKHELYPWAMPIAFESFDFSQYDLVISVTSEAAKGIITKPETKHLCYLLTPTRYLWSGYEEYFNSPIKEIVASPMVSYLKTWDKIAANRPDEIVCISDEVSGRCKKYYGKDSKVIYPPVDVERFNQKSTNWRVKARIEKAGLSWGKYFLVVARLVPYKKVELAIEVFNQLKWQLVVVGTGSELGNLKSKAGNSVFFAGKVPEADLPIYYQGCQALVFPQEEDFGIVAVEAQAAGKPVIAYRAGGALETVVEGKTGMFFDQQTPESLRNALEKFNPEDYEPSDCMENAEKFSKEKFLNSFATLTKGLPR